MTTDLLDINEAAQFCGVSRSTMYREIKRGRLTIIKVRGSTFIRKSELDRYLRANERVA